MKMLRLVGVRVVSVLPVALGVLTLTFFLSRVVAGDPIELFVPETANDQVRAELKEKFGLDKPVTQQYVMYMEDAARGDLGESVFTGRPVTQDLRDRLPATFELAALALLIAVTLGISLGVVSAIVKEGPLSLLARGVTLFGISVPGFWLGLVVLYVLFYRLDLFPGPVGRYPIGAEAPDGPTGLFLLDSLLAGDLAAFKTALHHLALPVLTLGFIAMAPIARVTRSAMLEALSSDYIRAARALAIPPNTIYFRYALKNAMLPVVTIIGGTFGYMFAGAVLTESVFNWPGVGLYALGALQQADYPALQGFVIWAAVAYVLAYMFVDVLYYVMDPRIR
jgi:peptide/nickel transport system permease protein